MPLSTLSVDGFDLLSNGVTCEKFDFPESVPTDDGRRAQQALEDTDSLEDAPWGMTLIVSGATAADVATLVTDITRRVKPGSQIALGVDDRPALNALVREVRTTGEEYYSKWARISFTGTRDGAWYSEWKSLTPVTVPLWGSADVTDAIDGDMPAQFAPTVISPLAATWLALGVKQAPMSGYDPTDDYSGTANAVAFGGQTTAATAVGSLPAYAAIGTAPTIDGNANRGSHILCARGVASSAATKLKAASKLVSLSTVEAVNEVPATVGATTMRGVVVGDVRVPVVDTPDGAQVEAAWLPEAVQVSHTTGTVVGPPTEAVNRAWQTFTLTQRTRVLGVTMRGYSSAQLGGETYISITNVSDGLPDYPWIAHSVGYRGSTLGDIYCPFDVVLEPGQYAIETPLDHLVRDTAAGYAGGQGGYSANLPGHGMVVGDGTDTSIDWYFKIHGQVAQEVGTTTPLYAAGTGTLALDVVTRIPADDLAILATHAFAANQGFTYEPDMGLAYLANSVGVVGNSIRAEVRGKHRGLAPNATNTLVAAGDVGANAPGNITVGGKYRERWRRLSRSA